MADAKIAPPVLVSKFVEADSKPDGDLAKPMWSDDDRASFDQAAFSDEHYPEFKTSIASRWTAEFLYLAFWCPYRTLTVYEGEDIAIKRTRLWERDVVEAFIHTDSQSLAHYYEFEVAPNNQWLDVEIDLARKPFNNEQWNSGFEHATRVDAVKRVWTVEMRIPVCSMGVASLRRGMEWKANFFRSDGAGEDSARRMMSWGRLPIRVPGGTYHQPDSFGFLRFGGPL
jgi:hypothetical protein